MFNDIFYFVNASERNYLKEELQDLAGKKIIICKRMKKDSSSYEELLRKLIIYLISLSLIDLMRF